MSRITSCWKSTSALQRRALGLIFFSLIAGFFLSRREDPRDVSFVSSGNWQEFISTSQPAFRAKMPSQPRHDVRDMAIARFGLILRKGIFTSVDATGGQYVLAVGQYPEQVAADRHKWLVAEAASAFPASSQSDIQIEDTSTGGIIDVRRFDGGPQTRAQFVIQGRYGYWLQYTASPTEFSQESSRMFFGSFHPGVP